MSKRPVTTADRFRFSCSLNAAGQVLCYSYAWAASAWAEAAIRATRWASMAGTSRSLTRPTQVVTVKVWNSLKEMDGQVVQTPSSDPVVMGSFVKVAVNATNVGSPAADGMLIAPIDPDAEYVTGSAYGGATPLTAMAAAQLAAAKGLTDLAARANGAAPHDVVAVAWMGPVATGEELMFGFTVKVTAMSGELQHDVAVFDGATFIHAIVG